MTEVVKSFLLHADTEQPKTAKALRKLNDKAHASLAEVLALFDYRRTGELAERERQLAYRVVRFLHRPSAKGLELLLAALRYLDLDRNESLNHGEITLAVEILELFCKADSVNDTLSVRELEILLGVFKKHDTAGLGVLSASAQASLRDALWDPDTYLASLKE